MEIGFPIKEDNVKHKGLKGSDAFQAADKSFWLAFIMGPIWDLIEEIFNMWDNIGIKNKKSEKSKVGPWTGGKSSPDVKEFLEDMNITPWRTMQGVKDETLLATLLSQVNSCELSMEEMCNEFDK